MAAGHSKYAPVETPGGPQLKWRYNNLPGSTTDSWDVPERKGRELQLGKDEYPRKWQIKRPKSDRRSLHILANLWI
jgi:hypothetical protein